MTKLIKLCRSQWPCGLRHGSAAARLLGLWVRVCGEGPVTWNWTKKLLAYILRVDHRQITQNWTIRPDFQHWPPQRQAAVLWIVAHFVHYRLLSQRRLSLQDYVDFMRRARWKLYQQPLSPRPTGRYLEVIDWPQY